MISPKSCRAAVLNDFGKEPNFTVCEVPIPSLRSDEILVRVKATSVNPIEWKMRQGMVLPAPLLRSLLGKPMILGIDYSGTVVGTGSEVGNFRPGDDVMGALHFSGADSEYIVVRPRSKFTAIAVKPSSISHAEAAAGSFAGLVALAGMTSHGGLAEKRASRVLVIGASGGVGHLAIQIAKHCIGAALVVGVCSSRNVDFVRSCGADCVIAYDLTAIESIPSQHPEWRGTFDLIFDAVGVDHAWTGLAPWLLSKDGRFVSAALPQTPDGRAGEDVGTFGMLATWAKLNLRRIGGRYRFIYGFMGDLPSKTGFPSLVKWMAEGKVAVKLAGTYSLEQLAEAHRASETGRTVGKVSVVIS